MLVKPMHLTELRLELLKDCGLICRHCSAYAAPHNPKRLTIERVMGLITEFSALGGKRVTLTGGEPLMYSSIVKVGQKAAELGLTVRLFSSGIVSEAGVHSPVKTATLTALSPSIATIMYSVYSADPSDHDYITHTSGSHEMTTEAIRRTIQAGIGAEIHLVLTRKNYRGLSVLTEYATELGVQRIGLLRFVPQGRGKLQEDRLTMTTEDYHWLRSEVIRLRFQNPGLDIHLGSAHNFLELGHSPCTAALDTLVVDADGNIAPCSGFGDFRIDDPWGNILTQSLAQVWEHSVFLQEVRQAHTKAQGCPGCLAQKALFGGRVDADITDPLEARAA